MTEKKFSPLITTIIALCALVAFAGIFCGQTVFYHITVTDNTWHYTKTHSLFGLPGADIEGLNTTLGLFATIFATLAILCLVFVALSLVLPLFKKAKLQKTAFWCAVLTIVFAVISIIFMLLCSNEFFDTWSSLRVYNMYYGAFMIYCSCIVGGIFYIANDKKELFDKIIKKSNPLLSVCFCAVAFVLVAVSLFLTHTANGTTGGATLWQTISSFDDYLFFYSSKLPLTVWCYLVFCILTAISCAGCVSLSVLTLCCKKDFGKTNQIAGVTTFLLIAGTICSGLLNCNLRNVPEAVSAVKLTLPAIGFWMLVVAGILCCIGSLLAKTKTKK
ncbi:MAG: hypothetical protein IJV77_00125 [Clostridia bacterium]|nr:hypothetical protein [Clostridia bacterium]